MAFYYLSKEPGPYCLVNIFTLDFEFNAKEYHCIVRSRNCDDMLLYFVTLLNAEMEELFTEPYILIEKDGKLNIDLPAERNDHTNIKVASGISLKNYLAQSKPVNGIKENYYA